MYNRHIISLFNIIAYLEHTHILYHTHTDVLFYGVSDRLNTQQKSRYGNFTPVPCLVTYIEANSYTPMIRFTSLIYPHVSIHQETSKVSKAQVLLGLLKPPRRQVPLDIPDALLNTIRFGLLRVSGLDGLGGMMLAAHCLELIAALIGRGK